MEKKNLWTIIAVALIVVIAAGIVYWQLQKGEQVTVEEEQQAVEDIQEALQQAAETPEVDVPQANPLQEVLPTKNPVVNPFQDVYQNPFE